MEDGNAQQQGAGEQTKTAPEPGITQEQVDAIVEKRLARQRDQFNQRLATAGFESFDALDEHATAQRQAAADAEERKRKRLESEGKHAELLQLEQRKFAELEKSSASTVAELRAEIAQRDARVAASKVRTSLIEAATAAKVVAPGQVADLLTGRVQAGEDGNVYVLGDDGKPRLNGAGGHVTVTELVDEFATKNPHFVAAAPGTGANSRAGGGPPAAAGQVDLTNRDPNYMIANFGAFKDAARAGKIKL